MIKRSAVLFACVCAASAAAAPRARASNAIGYSGWSCSDPAGYPPPDHMVANELTWRLATLALPPRGVRKVRTTEDIRAVLHPDWADKGPDVFRQMACRETGQRGAALVKFAQARVHDRPAYEWSCAAYVGEGQGMTMSYSENEAILVDPRSRVVIYVSYVGIQQGARSPRDFERLKGFKAWKAFRQSIRPDPSAGAAAQAASEPAQPAEPAPQTETSGAVPLLR